MATSKTPSADKKPAEKAAAKPKAAPKAAKAPAAEKKAAPAKAPSAKKQGLARRLAGVVDAPVGGELKITQMVGTIARQKDQQATLIGLGLNKRHRVSVLKDTPEVRGMLFKVKHLVKIEKVG